jgi:fumarate hydratase subunit alpha
MMIREIDAADISVAISKLFTAANQSLPSGVINALQRSIDVEQSPAGREVLKRILENAEISACEAIPLCQDTGCAVVFLKVGQDLHVTGGDLYAAVNQGVRRAYEDAYLRKSLVAQPYSARANTKDNTPAMIHTDIVPGDRLEITVMPKGGGAENMTRLGMLLPAHGRQGVIDFVVRAVDEAGSNPCPPVIVGVGIGGTAETTVLLAKKALIRTLGEHHPDPEHMALEQELLEKINRLGIGPMGFGGRVTALAVNVEVLPAHIASMPVAVNFQCHSARHKTGIL